MNRFKKNFPCPICGGFDGQERGRGKRCHGFLSEDSQWAHCAREAYSGGLPIYPKSKTFAHKLFGNCNCGIQHSSEYDTTMKDENTKQYDYKDEHGEVLYQVCRAMPKKFFQRRPDDNGGWIHNLQGVRRVLYRLPELLAADAMATVFVCEGEKDVEALRKLGLVATTNSGGAEKWNDKYSEVLRGRDVVILPDNDDTGRKHAQQVSRSLSGIAARVRIIQLPNLPEKGDVSDWLKAGGTAELLQEMVQQHDSHNSSISSQENESQEYADSITGSYADEDLDVCMADVEPEEVEWLIAPYIPLGKLIIVEGDPDEGKSFATLAIAAAITRGASLPFGAVEEAGNVLLLSAEDGRADTIRPRLDLLGADVRRVFAVKVPLVLDDKGFGILERSIVKREAKMVLFDPLFAFVGGKVDINQDNKVRAITSRLSDIAERTRCSIVALRHLPKAQQRNAKMAGSNSIAWTASARSVLLFGHDPSDESERGFVHTKHNLSKQGASQGYRIDDVNGKPLFHWTGASNLTSDKILGAPDFSRAARSEIDRAEEFLSETLHAGAVPQQQVEKLAKRAHISTATLRRAKAKLGVNSFRPTGGVGAWFWRLPLADAQDCDAEEQGYVCADEHVADEIPTTIDAIFSADVQAINDEHVVAGERYSNEHVVEHRLTPVNKEDISAKADAQKDVYRSAEHVDISSAKDVLDNIEDDWLERAAIIEFDSGYSRKDAERLARLEYFKPVPLPAVAA
jgi:hypothetical protein